MILQKLLQARKLKFTQLSMCDVTLFFFSLYKKKLKKSKHRANFFSKQYEMLEHFFYLCPNVNGRVVRPMSWFWQLTWVLLQEFSASHSSSGMISFSILDHKIYLLCHIKVINMGFFYWSFFIHNAMRNICSADEPWSQIRYTDIFF